LVALEPYPATRPSDADTQNTLPGDEGEVSTVDEEGDGGDPVRGSARARTPEMLGRYVLLSPIGAGGMGEVYAAYDPELDRKVAIKVVRTGRDRSERAIARLRREAQALAKLSHPHVVPIYDVGSSDGQMFFAMELVHGETLDRWCSDKAGDVEAIVPRFVEAALGLQAAHDTGIIHRDVKPENLLLGDDGRVRVLDLGIAKLAGAATDVAESSARGSEDAATAVAVDPASETADALYETRLTSFGAVMGTPAFMSPEQYEGAKIDARSDQFGFCASLFSCLYGEDPFQAKSYTGMCAAIVEGRIAAPSREADVPARIRQAIRRGLSVRPDDRFESMNALIAELAPVPHRRGRGALAAGFAAVIVGLATWNVVSPPGAATSCEVPEDTLTALWSEGLEAAVRKASASAPAADHFVERAQTWRSRYAAAARTACEQTEKDGKFSGAVLDARTRCLDRHAVRWRAQLDAVVAASQLTADDLFSLAPDPSAPDRCLDVVTATGQLDASDAAQRQRRLELVAKLARARTVLRLGDLDAATATAQAVVEAAGDAHHDVAEAHLILGLAARSRVDAGDPEALELALDHLVEAAAKADLAADDGLRAEVYIELVHLTGHHQRRLDEARSFVTLADGALGRMGGRAAPQRHRLFEHYGLALYATGHPDQAIEQFRLARAAYESLNDGLVSPADPIEARLASNLGNARLAAGDLEAAVTDNGIAVELAVKAHGETHPLTCGVLNNFGVALHASGEHERARTTHARSLACREAVYGETDPHLANAMAGLGLANLELGELAEARSQFRAAKRLRGRNGRPEDEAETAFGLARAIHETDPTSAHALATEALMLYGQVATQKAEVEAVQTWLAEHPAP